MRGRALLTASLLLLASVAEAQSGVASGFGPLFLPGAQYGAPLKWSASLSVVVETKVDGEFLSGVLIDGRAGQGGISGGIGYISFLEYVGVDLRAVVSRTGLVPRGATPEATYAGGEAGLTIAFARFAIGVARRISGPGGPHGTDVTWSVGAHVPIWWRRSVKVASGAPARQ